MLLSECRVLRQALSRMWHRPGRLALHLALLVISIGGLLTAVGGTRGYLLLTPDGRSSKTWLTVDDATPMPLPSSVRLDSFVVTIKDGIDVPTDYISYLTLCDDRHATVSVNSPLVLGSHRLYQASYDVSGASALEVDYDPWRGRETVYLGYILLCIGFIMILADRRGRFRTMLRNPGMLGRRQWAFATAVIIAAISVSSASYLGARGSDTSPAAPVLISSWLPVHVGLVMTSYTLLAVTPAVAMVAVVRPSERIKRHILVILYPALFLLAAGIASGSVWAGDAWGRYWGWDPKETWALITFIVYCIPLHFDMKPQRLGAFCIAAFLCVVMTYWGVNYMVSLHSYGS